MGLRLSLYLSFIVIGGIVGRKFKLSKKFHSTLSLIQSVCLLSLLFTMGIKIGLDNDVLGSFFNIGFKAVLISVFSIVFSILGVFFSKKDHT